MVPTAYAAIVLLVGLMASRTGLLRAQVLFCVLGGTSALTLPALGGSTIVVPAFCLPFFVVRAYLESVGTGAARRISPSAFWLTAAIVWGLAITFTIPRALRGELQIITLDRLGTGAYMLTPLRPVSGNISQAAFAVANAATFIAARYLLRLPERVVAYSSAVLWLATINCLAAALNLAEHYLPIPNLLEYVRTAYRVYETYEQKSTGLVRIHGTFPEASVFSSFSLGLFGFTFSLWLNRVRSLWTGTLAALLLAFLLFSTSGTAYGGLAIYGSLFVLGLLRRAWSEGRMPRSAMLFSGVVLATTVAVAMIVFEAPLVDRVIRFFQATVIDKLETKSGVERTLWNLQAWRNFVESYGLGVGIGTARPSSFVLTVLSNIGAIGTFFYGLFLYHVLRPANPRTQGPILGPISEASRHAVLATLSGAVLSGSSFDRGAVFYLFAAAASLRATAMRKPATSQAPRRRATSG